VKRLFALLAPAVAAAFAMISCAARPAVEPAPRVGVESGTRITVELVPGPQYAKQARVLWYTYTVRPQVAAWLETHDGRYVATLYVTEAVVTRRYRSAPKTGRPEALPVWSHLSKEQVDAVSSPTTAAATVKYGSDQASSLPVGKYIVKLETNRSYDWNRTYTKKNSGVNGQPSLVYEAEIEVGSGPVEASFRPVGRGSVDGRDGRVQPGLNGIDTALELFTSLKVAYIPG